MNAEGTTMIALPKYRCHKEVRALKIKSIEIKRPTIEELEAILNSGDGSSDHAQPEPKGATITPENDGYAPFDVTQRYMRKHDPQPGGYWVQYEDGYQSYSPAKAFEEGYTRL